MKVFVTGVNGQLGHDVMRILSRSGHDCAGSGSSVGYRGLEDEVASMRYIQLNISDAAAVKAVLAEFGPDAVVHCAAWTNVDAAEEPKNLSRVRAVNVQGTENVARVCRELDCKMLYISTDYVFSGSGDRPYEPEAQCFAPLNVYGKTKLEGEAAVKRFLGKYFIVRTSWLYGMNGNNFVKAILDAGRKNGKAYVVNDQTGTPTYSLDLASLIGEMIESEFYGVYHASNSGGYISWYDFAREIYRQAGLPARLFPVSSEVYGCTKARRPMNSRMDISKLSRMGFTPLPSWQDALGRFLKELP
ncbi:MAG: dTDP-4-dehydrorhamnose reductase [Oscillospiraceae bacterium]|nr:dTDP-4-dehydrorhamnose reductase [Oscillospiraceae bacterium]